MKLSEERIAWLQKVLGTADYCHIGTWGGEETWDVQQDLEDALDDIAQLEAYCDKLADGLPEGMLPKDIELLRSSHTKLLAENERMRKIERLAGKVYRASMSPSLIRSNRDPRNCFPTWWFNLCLGWLGEALGGE